jgi:hypothetical protein
MKAREERKELEKLITKSSDEITQNVPDENEDLAGLQGDPLIGVDFSALQKQCEKEARSMMKNAIRFMIPIQMIKENQYLKNKFKVDVISLSGMLYQLRSNEIVQRTLMEQINLGMAHPRMFEVFSGMSKTIGELNKQLIQTVEAIKQTYKGLKEDDKEGEDDDECEDMEITFAPGLTEKANQLLEQRKQREVYFKINV